MRWRIQIQSVRLSRFLVGILALVLLLCLSQCTDPVTEPTGQQAAQTSEVLSKVPATGLLRSGSTYYVFAPPSVWGRDLVIYAHGYYSPDEAPWRIENDTVEGTPIHQIVNSLGFAYATTSYPAPGLIVPAAVQDVIELANFFTSSGNFWTPPHIYLIGASEGGLITTLAVEQHPNTFSGGLATCGPIGDFRKQIDYFGDFNVVFNYFFQNVLPGATPLHIPDNVIQHWGDTYRPAVLTAIASNASATRQLLQVTHAAVDPGDPTTVSSTVVDVLWYNVFATNDALDRLDGQPFDNTRRIYLGSSNDWQLNRGVQRVHADPQAIGNIDQGFQTTGRLVHPLVTLHTTGDPIIPYWHETLYFLKVMRSGSLLRHCNIPIIKYGHCKFTTAEVLAGFAVLVLKVTLHELSVPVSVLPKFEEQTTFMRLAYQHGARPKLMGDVPPNK